MLAVLVLVFLIVPTLIIVPMSSSGAQYILRNQIDPTIDPISTIMALVTSVL